MISDSDQAPAAPDIVDVTTPNTARIYDYYLGGSTNWAVDREFADQAMEIWPNVRPVSWHNRLFGRRVVRHALAKGIRQFIDIGSGLPTRDSVHEVVQNSSPDAGRVVYVDYDPAAEAHTELILNQQATQDWCTVVHEDIRQPRGVLEHPDTEQLIDFREPVCLLMTAVLHFLGPRDNIPSLLAHYSDALSPGSWLALSHITSDRATHTERAAIARFATTYRDTTCPMWIRDSTEIASWFDGLEEVAPGVVPLPDWRPERFLEPWLPDVAAVRPCAWCGVGQKPAT